MDKLEYIEKQLDDLKLEIKESNSCRNDLEKKILITEQSMKSFYKRIDKVEEQTEAIVEMAHATKSMSEKVEKMVTLFENHDTRLDSLERAPGDFFKNYAKVFLGALLTGVAGAVVTNYLVLLKK
jgi:chromosome condensin MukBEF ATPase and DNA-binding subunit MukB